MMQFSLLLNYCVFLAQLNPGPTSPVPETARLLFLVSTGNTPATYWHSQCVVRMSPERFWGQWIWAVPCQSFLWLQQWMWPVLIADAATLSHTGESNVPVNISWLAQMKWAHCSEEVPELSHICRWCLCSCPLLLALRQEMCGST